MILLLLCVVALVVLIAGLIMAWLDKDHDYPTYWD